MKIGTRLANAFPYRLFIDRLAEFAVFVAGHAPIVVLNDREDAASKAVRRHGPETTLRVPAAGGEGSQREF